LVTDRALVEQQSLTIVGADERMRGLFG
jgi:hypothetical protein